MAILLIILIILLLMGIGAVLPGLLLSAPAYKGPVSDHFDGRKFHNPGGVRPEGFGALWKWMKNRDRGLWSEKLGEGPVNYPPGSINDNSVLVTFVNHSTFLIQTKGLNILTDPVWSDRASPVSFAGPKRMRSPGILLDDLPKVDMVLLTHNHYDHLDIRTMVKLGLKHRPDIYCPLGVDKYLSGRGIQNIRVMDWWDSIEINKEMKVICTPAQHFSGRGMFDRDRTLWCGFALGMHEGAIYYSGDTGYGGFFEKIAEKIGPIRLAFLPIGAYKPAWFMAPVHTSPADALRIHREIGSPKSIGMHFGTFPLADDGMDEAVDVLEQLKEAEGIGQDEFMVLRNGEILFLR